MSDGGRKCPDAIKAACVEGNVQELKSVIMKVGPFFHTAILYFVVFTPVEQPSMVGMVFKCLPILSLALFVILHTASHPKNDRFSRRILAGLLFSCLGDAFLVWPSYFLHGMAAFGVAQCFYIRAFGFESLNWRIGASVYIQTAIGITAILPGLLKDEGPIQLGIPFYSFVLTTMLWRALSRVQLIEDLWTWTKCSGAFGSLCFAISDTVLALDKFYVEIPKAQAIVMVTYYLAQLGIALTVVNFRSKPDGSAPGEKKLLS